MKMPHAVKIRGCHIFWKIFTTSFVFLWEVLDIAAFLCSSCLPLVVWWLLGPQGLALRKKESLFFSDWSLTLPGGALQKGLGRTAIHVGTAEACWEEMLYRGLFLPPCSSSPFACRSWFLNRNMSFMYVVTVFQDIKIVTVNNYPHLVMIGQKCTILIWWE